MRVLAREALVRVPDRRAPSSSSRRVRLLLSEAELRRGWRMGENLRILDELQKRGAKVRVLSRGEAELEC